MSPELTAWFQQQYPWLQVAARRLAASRHLSETDIQELAMTIKNATPAPTGDLESATQPPASSSAAEVRLISIGPVEGFDALNPRSPLNFVEKNLTVVYGHNGSGKSGYTRILCKASGKSHARSLRSNVFAAPPARQICKIKYALGEVVSEIEWSPDMPPIEALSHLDIFDSTSSGVYLEGETEVAFLPSELVLFTDLVSACVKVENLLDAELRALVCVLPAMPPEFTETAAAATYRTITHTWTESQLAALTTWTDQSEQELHEINGTLAVADPRASALRRREVKSQREAIGNTINHAISQLTDAGFQTSRSLFADASEKRNIAREASELLRAQSVVDGIGSVTWRSMWEAARNYALQEALPGKPFPYTESESRCVFCHQELDVLARQRLSAFEIYVSGQVETEATLAEKVLAEHIETITTRPATSVLLTAAQAAELDHEMTSLLEDVWAELETRLRALRERQMPAAEYARSENVKRLLESLGRLANSAEAEAVALIRSADPEARRISEGRRKELLSQKWISEQAAAVRDEVARQRQVHAYQDWKRQTSTTAISRKAGELSQTLITEAYISRFNRELAQLGAIGIRVELVRTRTERGRVKHLIRLRNAVTTGVNVAEILSEGERRIISLAAFLADVTGRTRCSPFIFDDPISSLDQTWEERTIDRLIALSHSRQVIVFTHRLSLLGVITDKADDQLNSVHIRRETWGTGDPGEVPLFGKRPEAALRKLKSERVPRARRTLNEQGHEQYYPLGKAICSDVRILVERIVELVILADVVQRHRRAVQTMGRIHQLAKINAEDCALVDEIMSKYSCYEHSQSQEAPVELPHPDDIEADIDRLLTWHNEFKLRSVSAG